MRLLPPANIPSHTVFVSIALQNSTKSATPASEKAEQLLLRLCSQLNVPATWGLADPASESAEAIRSSGVSHEIALLIEPNVESRRELLGRLDTTSRDGAGISTVFFHAPVNGEMAELLARHGVSIIACDRPAGSHGRNSAPVTTVRFGLWEVAAAASISNAAAGVERRLRRKIDDTAAVGGLFHLAIDATAVGRSVAAARMTERLLGHIAERRDRGALRVQIATQIAAQFRRRPSAPAKSILRISASQRAAA
jgi:hypothetical protein